MSQLDLKALREQYDAIEDTVEALALRSEYFEPLLALCERMLADPPMDEMKAAFLSYSKSGHPDDFVLFKAGYRASRRMAEKEPT